MPLQKTLLSFAVFVFAVSLSVVPGCSEPENTVLEPSPKEKRAADEARGVAATAVF